MMIRPTCKTLSIALSTVLGLLAISSSAYAQAQYRVTQIGNDPNVSIRPTAINDKGEVAGIAVSYQYPDDENAPVEEVSSGFLWRRGKLHDLGHLGVRDTAPTAINDRGHVVGDSTTLEGENHIYRGFYWHHGDMTALDVDHAEDVNKRGQVVGYECHPEEVEYVCNGLLWQRGELVNLGALPPSPAASAKTFADPFAINARGEVVGWSYLGDGYYHAFIWQAGVMSDLGVLPNSTDSAAVDINNHGQVIGTSASAPLIGERGFLWQSGQMTELPRLTADQDWTVPQAINDRGAIVGSTGIWATGQNTATVWLHGVAYDLNALIHPYDPLKRYAVFVDAIDINDRGQIIVRGYDSREPFSSARGYLLTPLRSH